MIIIFYFFQFETSISAPGHYVVRLEAWNDLTPPISVELPIIVEHSITDAQLQITGGLVGHKSLIQVAIFGYLPFCTVVDFGDGTEKEICNQNSFANITSLEKSLHLVSITHIYSEYGEFLVRGIISNTVSNVTCSEVFVPIVSISLLTRSPWVMKTPGHVVVTAVVEGGRDLQFIWDFSDNYEETLVKRYHKIPKYRDTLCTYPTCPKIWNSLFYYLLTCLKYTAICMANSVDPDHSAASDLCLHCLQRPIPINT